MLSECFSRRSSHARHSIPINFGDSALRCDGVPARKPRWFYLLGAALAWISTLSLMLCVCGCGMDGDDKRALDALEPQARAGLEDLKRVSGVTNLLIFKINEDYSIVAGAMSATNFVYTCVDNKSMKVFTGEGSPLDGGHFTFRDREGRAVESVGSAKDSLLVVRGTNVYHSRTWFKSTKITIGWEYPVSVANFTNDIGQIRLLEFDWRNERHRYFWTGPVDRVGIRAIGLGRVRRYRFSSPLGLA